MASSASVTGATGVGSSTTAAAGAGHHGTGHSTSVSDIIEYKVRLLGLLPDGYMYSHGPTRWDLSTASFCKIPSEMTCYDGKIDRKGHPTLIGSGILERKYGLTVQLPTIAESERAASVARSSIKEQEEGEEEEDDGTHNEDDVDDDADAILEEDEDEVDGSGNESGSECSEYDKRGKPDTEPKFICQECQQNAVQNQKDNLMTKWLKNNYDPRRDALPDIVCRRTVLTYIMTQKQPFILNAKKISFISSSDPERKEHTVIHVEFDYLPSPDCEPHPPGGRSRAASRASKTPDEMPTSEKNFDAESYYEKPNLIGYFAGKLCCRVATIPPENRSIRILLSAIVDGLWNKKPDPELYRTGDLAEVKSTMDTTVVSDPAKGGSPHFFKQVRMAHAWAQCHLVGISRMMVGVHTLVPGNFTEDEEEPAYGLTSRPRRILQELWLYDVEKMPTAVKISSEEDGFRAWSPTELKWKLYTALQQIRLHVRNSDEGVTHRFLHYFNEDFLVPMTLEELQLEWKAIHEANRTLVFRNVHIPQTSPDVIELSLEEVEQEHAEKQVDLIINSFLGLGIPVETLKVVRIMGIRKELEVIFPYESLARRVYSTFRLFLLRNRFLPQGFERIRVDIKRTKRLELERMRRKGAQNFYSYIPPTAPTYSVSNVRERGERDERYCHHTCHTYGQNYPYARSAQPSPFPPPGHTHTHTHTRQETHPHVHAQQSRSATTGRHHHHHHHHHGRQMGPVTTAGPSGIYGRSGPRRPGEEEDPWRLTRTMWR